MKGPNPLFMVGSPDNQTSIFRGFPKVTLSSEAILGTEDRTPSVIRKGAPVVPILQEIPSIWGAVSHEPWIRTKYILLITMIISLSILCGVIFLLEFHGGGSVSQ